MSLNKNDEITKVSRLAISLHVKGFMKCLIVELVIEDLNQSLS